MPSIRVKSSLLVIVSLVAIFGGMYITFIDPLQRDVVGRAVELPEVGVWTLIGDEEDYFTLAMNLLWHGQYSLSLRPPYEPSAYRVPWYPVFLASVFSIFGAHLNVALVANLVLLIIISVLAFLIGRDLYGERVGLLAAFLCAINPALYFFSIVGNSEPLYCALLLLSIYSINRSDQRLDTVNRWSVLSGVVLAMAFLTRPAVLLLPLVFAVWLSRRGQSRGASTVYSVILLLLAFCVGIAPWAVRNKVSVGHLAVLPLQRGGVFLRGALAARESSGAYIPRGRAGPEDRWIMMLEDEGLQDREAWRKGVAVIRQMPYGRLIKVVLLRIGRFWVPLNRIVRGEVSVGANVMANMIYIPVFLLFLAGAVIEGLQEKKGYLLFLTMAYSVIPAMIFHAGIRFRMPIEPLMAIFAGLALDRFVNRLFKSGRGWIALNG